jgi:integrase
MPQQEKLTNKSIVLAAPGRHHAGVKGLYLYVSPDEQVRRWLYRYTSPVTRRVTETGFGSAIVLPLAEAKKKAEGLERQIAMGVCPIHAKRAQRAEQATFKEACEGWIAVHKSAWKGGEESSQYRNCNHLLFHHGKPLLDKLVAGITADMVEATLKKLWIKHPLRGRQALGVIERVLDFARAKGMRTGDNPASWRGMHEYRFARVRKENRGQYVALPYEQMPAFMRDLRQRQGRGVGSVALEFTILTVARTGEALGMKWEEIDWDPRVWVVPAERMKAGKAHEVPLSNRAMEILRMQQEHGSGSGYVFEGYDRTRLDERTMGAILKRMGVKATVHGMRSAFRDWCGDETNFPREHVEACLAHRVGNSVELAYRRKTALEKRREILDHWASYCLGSVVSASPLVVG